MKINIMATGIKLTPAISDYVDKKILSIDDKYLGKDNDDVVAKVEVGKTTRHHKQGPVFKAEVHITGGGYDLYAVSEKDDLYTAIDVVKDEVSKEIRRGKGRQLALVRKGEQLIKGAMKGFSWSIEKFKGFRKKNE
jgi:putative sigma-54 modulation protein